jgi:hypothetical protein
MGDAGGVAAHPLVFARRVGPPEFFVATKLN